MMSSRTELYDGAPLARRPRRGIGSTRGRRSTRRANPSRRRACANLRRAARAVSRVTTGARPAGDHRAVHAPAVHSSSRSRHPSVLARSCPRDDAYADPADGGRGDGSAGRRAATSGSRVVGATRRAGRPSGARRRAGTGRRRSARARRPRRWAGLLATRPHCRPARSLSVGNPPPPMQPLCRTFRSRCIYICLKGGRHAFDSRGFAGDPASGAGARPSTARRSPSWRSALVHGRRRGQRFGLVNQPGWPPVTLLGFVAVPIPVLRRRRRGSRPSGLRGRHPLPGWSDRISGGSWASGSSSRRSGAPFRWDSGFRRPWRRDRCARRPCFCFQFAGRRLAGGCSPGTPSVPGPRLGADDGPSLLGDALGVLHTPTSNTTPMVTFPVSLIPTFFVPLFLLVHLLLFRRLSRNRLEGGSHAVSR